MGEKEEMNLRQANVERKTNETSVKVNLEIDGSGKSQVSTGIGFLDHCMQLFAKHGLFDLSIQATGDLQVDDHHTTEDVAIVLGQAFRQAMGEKKGVQRYGWCNLPMDESLAMVALDLSGRGSCEFNASFARESIGGLSTENVEHFFRSFATAAGCTLHTEVRGRNDHHKIEALFKGVARALRQACAIEARAPNDVPTTKGLL